MRAMVLVTRPGIAVAASRHVSYFLPTRGSRRRNGEYRFLGEMRCFVLHLFRNGRVPLQQVPCLLIKG